jgi:hypothetical protein
MNWKKATQEQRDAKNAARRAWRKKQGVDVGSHDGSKSRAAGAYILKHRDTTIVAASKATGVSYGLVWRVFRSLVAAGLVSPRRESKK